MIEAKEIKITLGTIVKELRTQKNITQEQLGEFLALQLQTIAKIETGRSYTSSEVLAKLCNFFNIVPSVFILKIL